MPWYISPLISLFLFILVLMIPLRLQFQVGSGEELAIQVMLGPIPLLRLPKKEKPIDLRQFTYAKHQKRLAKEAAKAKKKEKPSKKRSIKQSLQKSSTEAKKKDNELDGMLHTLRTLFTVVPQLYGSVKCQIYRLVVVVGGNDVTDVALHYGILSQSLACLLEYLQESSHLLPLEPEELVVRADFLAKDTTVQVDLCLQIRMGALMKVMGKSFGGSVAKQVDKNPGQNNRKKSDKK